MNKKITIVAATSGEVKPLEEYLLLNSVRISDRSFQLGDLDIEILISGIGILHTTYSLMDYLAQTPPDAWIQAGIGGAVDADMQMGQVYLIESEMLYDFGAQHASGKIMDPFELGWVKPDDFPYTNQILRCPFTDATIPISRASAMTTLYSHGEKNKIDMVKKGTHAQIENMEGAAFFYVSLMKKIPFLSLRAISNYLEPRDINRWNIPLAIMNLNAKLMELLQSSHGFWSEQREWS